MACPYVHRWFYIHALLWQGMTDRSDRLPIPQSFILWRICRVCCILNRKTDVSLGGFLNMLWHVPTFIDDLHLCLLWQGMTDRSGRVQGLHFFIIWWICQVCRILKRKTDVSLGGFFGHAMACPYEPRLWLFMPCYGKAWLTGPGSFMIPWSLAWWILILPPGKKEKVIIPSFWSHWSMIKSKIENLPWR